MAERPRYYAYDAGEVSSNMTPEPHRVHIRDMRPIAAEVELDRQGFALVEQHTAVRDFWDDEEVRRVYYPEAERLSPRKPAPAAFSSSTICSAAACRGRQGGRRACRRSRRPVSMSTTPRGPALSECAICCLTRPRNYSKAASR